MKQLPFYLKISIQIALIFTVMIFTSFIGDYLHKFLDDTYCTGWNRNVITGALEECRGEFTSHKSPTWHWGYRHWLLFLMGASLFITQVVRIVNLIEKES